VKFTATTTDGAWTELVDANSLSLGDSALRGQRVTHESSYYAAGCAAMRVVSRDGRIKAMWFAQLTTQENPTALKNPFTVESGDQVQAYSQAVV